MERQEVISELRKLIGDYLKIQGSDLIDLIYRHQGRDLILRILADRPSGGITLEECAQINKEVSRILDEKDILKMGDYILEVSSPGLYRPLKTKADFSRCINRRARFFLSEPIGEKLEWEGLIVKVEGDLVYIDIADKIMEIPLSKINRAKQVIGSM